MRILATLTIGWLTASGAMAQTTSIAAQQPDPETVELVRETAVAPSSANVENTSLIAVKEAEPKQFKVNDLLTVIVREQTQYEADGKTNARRQADFTSELDAFVKFTGSGIGATAFRRGKPNIEYKGTFNQRNDADTEREDRLTTRITATIIDIKPNGNLVFEASKVLEHDAEVHTMTLTGTCRSVDVTPDNTVLSSQIAEKEIKVATKGGIRNATRAGWLGTLFDWVRPL